MRSRGGTDSYAYSHAIRGSPTASPGTHRQHAALSRPALSVQQYERGRRSEVSRGSEPHLTEPNVYPTDTELVAANVATALSAYRAGEPVTAEWFHRRHRSLLVADRELLPRHLGAWRDDPVWVGDNRQTAVFEGPPERQVPALMDDLVRFVARAGVHPVVHAAIAHAQFETIHPYVDGNGRVGRLLIHQLLDAGTAPVPVAHGLLHDPTGYVSGLTAYRAGDLDTWVATFALAVADGATAAGQLVDRIDDLHQEYRRRVRTRAGSPIAAGRFQAPGAHSLGPPR